jgi:hypothetical protein
MSMNSIKRKIRPINKVAIIFFAQLLLVFAGWANAAELKNSPPEDSYCTPLGAHCWYIILAEGSAPNRVLYLADLKGRGWRVNDGNEDPNSPIRQARVIEIFENSTGKNPSYSVHHMDNECLKTKVRITQTESFWPDNRMESKAGDPSWNSPSALWMGRAAIFSCTRVIQNHLGEAGVIHAVDIYRPADVAGLMRKILWKETEIRRDASAASN